MGPIVNASMESFKTVSKLLKSLGPRFISMSAHGSQALINHKIKEGTAEVFIDQLKDESKCLVNVMEKLRAKWIDANDLERIRINQDIDYISKKQKLILVTDLAVQEINRLDKIEEPASGKLLSITKDSESNQCISESWMDRFEEIASKNNEPWRQQLLAAAISRESKNSGTISPRVLWLIGTLEERAFRLFSTLLELTSSFDGVLIIPSDGEYNDYNSIPTNVVGIDSVPLTVGHIQYELGDIGLLASSETTLSFLPNSRVFLSAKNAKFLLHCVQELNVHAVHFSRLGNVLASLCEISRSEQSDTLLIKFVASCAAPNTCKPA